MTIYDLRWTFVQFLLASFVLLYRIDSLYESKDDPAFVYPDILENC